MEYYIKASVASSDSGDNNNRFMETTFSSEVSADGERYATIEDVERIVKEAIAGMRVYILEADISEKQNEKITISDQSYF